MSVDKLVIKYFKDTGLDGRPYVILNLAGNDDPKLVARPEGIDIVATVRSRVELNQFAELVGEAWKEHLKLAPRISPQGVIE